MNYHFLKHKLSEFELLDEETKKHVLLNAAALTETYLDWDFLRTVLSPEQFEKMYTQEKVYITEKFSPKGELEDRFKSNFLENKLNNSKFIMALKGSFGLMRFDYADMAEQKTIFDIELSAVDLERLLVELQRVMQSHRDFNYFYDGNLITGEQIKDLLDLTLKTVQKERAKTKTTLKPVDIEIATLGIHGFSEVSTTLEETITSKDEKNNEEK